MWRPVAVGAVSTASRAEGGTQNRVPQNNFIFKYLGLWRVSLKKSVIYDSVDEELQSQTSQV